MVVLACVFWRAGERKIWAVGRFDKDDNNDDGGKRMRWVRDTEGKLRRVVDEKEKDRGGWDGEGGLRG